MTINGGKSSEPADTIRASITKAAEDMRAAAEQAKANAQRLEKEAEEISQFLIKTVTGFADRVATHLQQCDEASKAFQTHRDALANLPDLPLSATRTDATKTAMKALAANAAAWVGEKEER